MNVLSFLKSVFILMLFGYSYTSFACGVTEVDGTIPSLPIADFDSSVTGSGTNRWSGWSAERASILQVNTGESKCNSTGGWSTWVIRGALPASVGTVSGYTVFPTEYDNIVYTFSSKDPNGTLANISGNHRMWSTSGGTGQAAGLRLGINTTINFIFIGPVKAGKYTLVGRKIGEALISNNQNTVSPVSSTDIRYNNTTFTVTGATCELDAGDTNMSVLLPTVSSSSFASVGSTAGSTYFSMNLVNCPSGVTAHASMADANSSANTGQALTLGTGSTASGVGIQVLLANGSSDPISLGLGNQYYVAGSATETATEHNIPFIARYVKTSSTISPGVVNSQAVVSFFYD